MQEKNYIIKASFEKTKYFKNIFHLSQDIPRLKLKTNCFLTKLRKYFRQIVCRQELHYVIFS